MILRSLEFVAILLAFALILRPIILALFIAITKPAIAPLIRESPRTEFLTAEFVYGLPLPLSALVLSFTAAKILTALHFGKGALAGLLISLIVYALLSHGNKVTSLQTGVTNVPPSLLGIVTEVLVYVGFVVVFFWRAAG